MEITQIAVVVMIAVLLLMGFLMFCNCYRKVAPNQAMLISGFVPGGLKVLFQGDEVIWPLLCQVNYLSLQVIKVKVAEGRKIATLDGVVTVDALAMVKVKSDEESVKIAAERFLSSTEAEIAEAATAIITGHICALAARFKTAEMRQDMDSVSQKIWEASLGDLMKLGLTVESFTIRGIWETEGSPNASGTKMRAEAKSSAVLGEAQFAH